MESNTAVEILSTYDMSEDNDDTEFKQAIAHAIKSIEKLNQIECIVAELPFPELTDTEMIEKIREVLEDDA